jgi:hypothetical protein
MRYFIAEPSIESTVVAFASSFIMAAIIASTFVADTIIVESFAIKSYVAVVVAIRQNL